MGAISGGIGYLRFKVIEGDDTKSQFTRAINARKFTPLQPGADHNESAGWVALEAPFDDGDDIKRDQYEFGDRIIIVYRHDQWVISKPRLRRETRLRIAKICAEEGKPVDEVGKAFVKAVERAVLIDMRRQSTPMTKLVECVWTPSRGEMRAMGRGNMVCEQVVSLFERTFGVRCELANHATRAVAMYADSTKETRALARTFPTLNALRAAQ